MKDGSAGEFKQTAGKWYGDAEADKGIQTGPDSKFFSTWAELKKPFTNDKKDLVLQVGARARALAAPLPLWALAAFPLFSPADLGFGGGWVHGCVAYLNRGMRGKEERGRRAGQPTSRPPFARTFSIFWTF